MALGTGLTFSFVEGGCDVCLHQCAWYLLFPLLRVAVMCVFISVLGTLSMYQLRLQIPRNNSFARVPCVSVVLVMHSYSEAFLDSE